MSAILNEPRSVLLVGLEDEYDEAGSVLPGDVVTDVQYVDSIAGLDTTLAERADVGCVVTAHRLPDRTCIDLCRALRDDEKQIPVVLALDPDNAAVGVDALRAGATDCLYLAESTDEFLDRIEDAVQQYCEGQIQAEHSRLFTTLLDETPVAIYAKDENARHMAISTMPGELSRADVIGKTDVEMYQGKPTFAQEALEDELQVIEEEEPIRERLESYGPEGRRTGRLRASSPSTTPRTASVV